MVTVALVYPHISGTAGYALDFARLRKGVGSHSHKNLVPINYSSSGGGIGVRLGLLNNLK